MDVSDSISFAYCLDEDDGVWQQVITHVLDDYQGDKRIEALHAHIAAAGRLRRELRLHEQRFEAISASAHDLARTPRQILRHLISGIDYADPPPDSALTRASWEGLYAGTWSVIDHFEHAGRRYFFLYRTDTGDLDPLLLTPLQRGALKALSGGLGDADIAATLGVKLDAASALVRTVKKKLRIPVRRDLIGLNERCLRSVAFALGELACAVLYSTTALAEVIPSSISAAERSIIQLQLAGKNNHEIAQIRQVTYKTVSNQVATAYSKMNVRTCGEMLHNLRAASR
jgi:DNA-binding CsgD family transcriptional regulator